MSTLHEICGHILHNVELHATRNCHVLIYDDFNTIVGILLNMIIDLSNLKKLLNDLYEMYPTSELYSRDVMYTFSCPTRKYFLDR